MSRIKEYYHDEIVAEFEHNEAQRLVAEAEEADVQAEVQAEPIPAPPVSVLMERDEITGNCKPVQVYTCKNDAQDDLRLLRLGRRLFRIPETQSHYLVEDVPCL